MVLGVFGLVIGCVREGRKEGGRMEGAGVSLGEMMGFRGMKGKEKKRGRHVERERGD